MGNSERNSAADLLMRDLPPAQVTSKRSASRTRRWFEQALGALNGGVHMDDAGPSWDDTAIDFFVGLIEAARSDLAASLVVRLALAQSPLDEGQAALAAVRSSRWTAGIDVTGFVDQYMWPEHERELLARQVAREVHEAQTAERQRRAADQAGHHADRASEMDQRLRDEAVRQDAYRRRFPRGIAK